MTQLLNLAAQLEHRLLSETVAFLYRVGEVAVGRGEAAYLVGGGVRDLVLGRPALDLDMAVEGDAAGLAAELVTEGVQVVASSQFLTVKVRWRGTTVDLATARRESYPHPGSLPEVEPARLTEDLFRRDFTINALALSLSPVTFGLVIDPYGGVEDLLQGRVRVLHPSSFQDDATRLWRAVRYEQRLGFQLEPETQALVQRDAGYLETISPDRLRHEMDRTWEEGCPEKVMAQAAGLGLLAALSPPLPWDQELEKAFAASREVASLDIPLPHFYLALLGARMEEGQAGRLAARLNLPGEERRAVEEAARLGGIIHDLARAGRRPSEVVAALEPFAPAALQAWQLLVVNSGVWEDLVIYLRHWRAVRPALTGDDLLAMGVSAGPGLGRMLRALRVARLDGEVATAEEERALVRGWEETWREE